MQIFIELGNKTNFELFLTDANRATAYSFDWQSFVTELSWEKQSTPVGIVYEVSMKRTVLDKDDPNTTCTDYGAAGAKYTTYEKCMEEEQYIRFQSIFGCMHPLLTNNVSRACPSKVNNPDIPAYIDYLKEYLLLNMMYKQSKTIPECPLPCTRLDISLNEVVRTKTPTSTIILFFKDTIAVSTTYGNFTIIPFLVEIGGSFGFYLGLSCVSVLDLLEYLANKRSKISNLFK